MDADDDIEIGRRSWIRASLPIQQDAFREGYEIGRKAHYQHGFDDGYSLGFKNGFKMGLVNATLRVAQDLNIPELDGFNLKPYDFAHRGRCVMCPPDSEPITKEKMANVAAQYDSLEQVKTKQNTVVFPEEEITCIMNKCDQTSYP